MGQKRLVRKAEQPPEHRIAWPRWTGFQGKTAWDFLQLLIVPLAVIGLVFSINAPSKRNSWRINAPKRSER